jgi:hypothetical protein
VGGWGDVVMLGGGLRWAGGRGGLSLGPRMGGARGWDAWAKVDKNDGWWCVGG